MIQARSAVLRQLLFGMLGSNEFIFVCFRYTGVLWTNSPRWFQVNTAEDARNTTDRQQVGSGSTHHYINSEIRGMVWYMLQLAGHKYSIVVIFPLNPCPAEPGYTPPLQTM